MTTCTIPTVADPAAVKATVERFAPPPADPGDADGWAKHLALTAFVTLRCVVPGLLRQWEQAGRPKSGPARDAYVHAASAVAAQYGLAFMLREAPEAGGSGLPAPVLAAEVAVAYDGDMETVDATLAIWLEEWGINPGEVLRMAREEVNRG